MRDPSKARVLDSSAILSFLLDEPSAGRVARLLEEGDAVGRRALVSAPNWTEIRSVIPRRQGRAQAFPLLHRLALLPVEVVPIDRALAEAAADLLVRWKLSLGDSFAAALAIRHRARIYTTDPDFKPLAREVSITWL